MLRSNSPRLPVPIPALAPRYTKIEVLHSTPLSIVTLAHDELSGGRVVIKEVKHTPQTQTPSTVTFRHEISALALLRHPNILPARECFSSATHDYLVTDYCPEGDLNRYITEHGPLDESTAAQIFSQIVDAVAFCHAQGIWHRDIKAENVLITEFPQVKVADFGHCTSSPAGSIIKGICGTESYAAPECICRINCDPSSTDCWSLGVLLYLMVSGQLPWSQDRKLMSAQILGADYRPLPAAVSKKCRSLIDALLTIRPQDRLRAAKIRSHPWLEKFQNDDEIPPMPLFDLDGLSISCPLIRDMSEVFAPPKRERSRQSGMMVIRPLTSSAPFRKASVRRPQAHTSH